MHAYPAGTVASAPGCPPAGYTATPLFLGASSGHAGHGSQVASDGALGMWGGGMRGGASGDDDVYSPVLTRHFCALSWGMLPSFRRPPAGVFYCEVFGGRILFWPVGRVHRAPRVSRPRSHRGALYILVKELGSARGITSVISLHRMESTT